MRSNSHFYTFLLRIVNVTKKSFLHSFADSKCDQIIIFAHFCAFLLRIVNVTDQIIILRIFAQDSKCDQIIIFCAFLLRIVNVIK